jgi:hypothetical protein
MGAEGFRRAPMMQQKTDHADQNETHDWTEHKQIDYEKKYHLASVIVRRTS